MKYLELQKAALLAFLCTLGGSFHSCTIDDKAEEALPRLSVDTYELTLAKNGKSSLDEDVTFEVIANKGYTITSDQKWLGVDKPTGQGMVDVTVVADENDTEDSRTGTLTVKSGDLYETILITQTIIAPDPMRVFYHENFDWLIPFAKENSDPVGDNKGNSNRTNVTNSAIKEAWEASGLTDYFPTANNINAYYNYIHFNNNNHKYHPEYPHYDMGVILPRLDLGTETVNATITVQVSPDGTIGKLDVVPLCISIESGSGYVGELGTSKISEPVYPPTLIYTWSTFTFVLRDIASDTRIAIRSDGNTNDYCRWFLNDILIKETKL
jgi:hypothetical protein